MFDNPAESGARGAARMREIAVQNRLEIEHLTDVLVRGLEREVTAIEKIMAEQIASLVIRSRRLRDQGRDDSPQRRELSRLIKTTPWYAAPVVEAPKS